MATIYLSPYGDDNDAGTSGRPMASLAAAVERVRGTDSPAIELADGVYPTHAPVRILRADSGLEIRAAEGATAVVDGGALLTEWSLGAINGVDAFVADVSSVIENLGRPFHSLFAGGERRPRSRFPKEGYLSLKPSTEEPVADPFRGTREPVFADPTTVPAGWSLEGAELRVLHKWVDERMPVESFDAQTGRVSCRYRSIQRMTGETTGWKRERAFLENVREAVTEPGQWYLDYNERRLYVVARRGETVETFRACVPIALQLIRIEGELAGSPTANVTISGVTFRHTDWIMPVGDWGYRFDPCLPKEQWRRRDSFDHFIMQNKIAPDELYAAVPQAAHNTPGAIHLFGAHDCRLVECRFEHLGFYGVELGDGCQRNVIDRCVFSDIGGGAVNADGGNRQEEPHRHLRGNVISRNEIGGTGRVFLASCGVLIVFGLRNEVVANHIHDRRYTGISCGWSWGREHQIARENLIAYNHIHGIDGPDLLSDLGGIYVLGIQPGTVIRGNTIHDVHRDAYGGSGIYTDAATASLVVEDNLIYDIQGSGITVNHHNCENAYRRNVVAYTDEVPFAVMRNPTRFRDEFGDIGCAATIVSNIALVATSPYRYAVHPGEFPDRELARVVYADANVFWSVDGDDEPPEVAIAGWKMKPVIGWEEWKAVGADRTTVHAYPGFADPEARDFSLRPDSFGARVLASARWHPCTAAGTQPPLDAGGTSTVSGEEHEAAVRQ